VATFDVTNEPVFGIGVEPSATTFDASDFGYDFAIGGRAFLNAISKQTPYRRGLADIRKQQFDASPNPGEQSLDGYWLRSQQDFTGGAGITFMEPSNDEFQMKRFVSSLGVDPWTRGEMKLLKKAVAGATSLTSTKPQIVSADYGGDAYFITTDDSTVRRELTNPGAITGWTGTPNGNITSTGNGIAVCTTTRLQYLPAPFTGAKVDLAHTPATATMNAWWVKQRFIIADGHHLFATGDFTTSLNLAGAGNILYSHPLTTWKWTSVVETPDAILVAGYSGSKSAVYKFTINETNGSLPTLTSAITAAELPYGEVVTGMFSYLGSYVIIGTNRGVRVAEVDGNGNLAYGPLSYISIGAFTSITSFIGIDRFIYFNDTREFDDGNTGLIRMDLSSTDGAGRYAWATDLNSGDSNIVTSIAVANGACGFDSLYGEDRIGFVTRYGYFYLQNPLEYVESGHLITGQVRYNTLEPKNFRYFRLRGTTNTGTVNVSSVLYNQDPQSLFTFSDAVSIDQDITIAIPTNPQQESLGLKITLNRGAIVDGEYPTPTVTGWQLKAVPGSNRRILVKIPLLCFDHETDNAGTARGRDGYAYDRLVDLQSYCTTGAVVVFQDLRTGEQFSATVEDVSFTQEVANTQNKVDNFGGIIEVTVQQI
jgi:hypothetical protein